MMKNRGVYHIGVAVRSLKEGLALYRDQLGLTLTDEEELPDRGLKVAILQGGGTEVELLESISDDSAIGRFIAKRGPGIHHIAFEVEDIDASLRELKAQGVRLVDEVARPGASRTRVAFLHPAGTGGVLIELVEKPKA
jgi:methylmalonyl-CoA/ethylmalonyl-CoA epimerase